GLGWGKTKPPFIRKLWFPLVGAGANENSASLYKEFKAKGATSDSAVGQAVLDAESGKRQYARLGIASGGVFGRTLVLPFSDTQIAAVSKGDGTIDTRYRSMSGLGFGFSAQDSAGRLSLGY